MNDYQKNVEVMAHSLALMLAPIVVLSEDDSLDVYSLELHVRNSIAYKMRAEYFNGVEVSPATVRGGTADSAYMTALIVEFDRAISDSCEQWIRKIQKEDAPR